MKKKLDDVLFIAILLRFCFHGYSNRSDFIYIFFIINPSDIKNNEVSTEIRNGFSQHV